MSERTPGPIESLARLAIQSDRYTRDEESRTAVDAVIRQPVYDAASDLLKALCKAADRLAENGIPVPSDVTHAIAKAKGEV